MTNGAIITVPKEVADAIKVMRDQGTSDYYILTRSAEAISSYPEIVVKRWMCSRSEGVNALMDALVNGYQVEAEPVTMSVEKMDLIRKYYVGLGQISPRNATSFMEQATEEVVEILGLNIAGIPRSKRSQTLPKFRQQYGIEGVNA